MLYRDRSVSGLKTLGLRVFGREQSTAHDFSQTLHLAQPIPLEASCKRLAFGLLGSFIPGKKASAEAFAYERCLSEGLPVKFDIEQGYRLQRQARGLIE